MLLGHRQFFIKERVAFLKLTDVYDILDPVSGEQIGTAREEPPDWAKYLRLVVNKHLLPTRVNIYEGTGEDGTAPAFSITRSVAIFRPKVTVIDARGAVLGRFVTKVLSFSLTGGNFFVHDPSDNVVAEVKGDWKGWNFRFLDAGGNEIGLVAKKWAGLGKELFTSADNYIISLTDSAPRGPETAALLLAAGLAIDLVFKEGRS